ncbi:RNA 5'-monophosphate methyltransferase [Neodiprion lecontei]|uniref:RNA methyltransferase n=1 Tax=Neodiprion lecontei TaxID=441921 RepID=A0A6J0BCB4_NEOLC|nr:RNA 5'-monophosphate methyltransferase [Neodiprion lecontei]
MSSNDEGSISETETRGYRVTHNKTDPGACRHGNFINYYQFHPAEERLRQLPRGVWHADPTDRKYVGLDVGCNAGNLTLALYDFLRANIDDSSSDNTDLSLLGVDLDPVLIERAKEGNDPNTGRDVTYKCMDFMAAESSGVIDEFLTSKGRDLFDVAFCFSVTMWIHLNHGDSGLVQFLRSVCEKTRIILVEPQPWKCYRNASRRLKRANVADFPMLQSLRYTGEMDTHVENILTEHCGFDKLTESGNNDWGRKLLIFKRKQTKCDNLIDLNE